MNKIQDKKETLKSKSSLNEKQQIYAEWLAKPPDERSPSKQSELSIKLNVAERTLSDWKKNPELWKAVNAINVEKMTNLVAPAIALMEKAVKGKQGAVNRVSYDAARGIVKDWGKRTESNQDDVAHTVVELYHKYN